MVKKMNPVAETCYLLSNPCNAEHIRKRLEQADNGELVDVKIDEL